MLTSSAGLLSGAASFLTPSSPRRYRGLHLQENIGLACSGGASGKPRLDPPHPERESGLGGHYWLCTTPFFLPRPTYCCTRVLPLSSYCGVFVFGGYQATGTLASERFAILVFVKTAWREGISWTAVSSVMRSWFPLCNAVSTAERSWRSDRL